MPRLRGGVVGI